MMIDGHRLPFDVIQPNWTGLPSHVRAFTTLRCGGKSIGPFGDVHGNSGLNLGDHVTDQSAAVEVNRQLLNTSLPSDVIFLSQVHGNMVAHAETVIAGTTADAVVSVTPGLVCAVLTADCLPVLLCDEMGQVVAAAHAGWRGLATGILENTIKEMRLKGAGEIIAWLGPAIGPGKFEVGQDVCDVFINQNKNAAHFFVKIVSSDGCADSVKYLADIYQLARLSLTNVGVTRIFGGDFCTVSDKEKFYSYRRDGVTGRMANLVWIDPAK